MGDYRLKILREDPDFEAAMTWALGPTWAGMQFLAVPAAWNARHGELFIVDEKDSIDATTERMIDAYKKMRSFEVGLSLPEDGVEEFNL